MILSVLVTFGIYLSSLYLLVFHKIVDRYHVIEFTQVAMSSQAYTIVVLIGVVLWYFFGQKCWKIVYIDKVYYFDKKTPEKK